MKLPAILLMIATAALAGCVVQHKVTLSQATEVYSGTRTFDSGYTGVLTIPNGPGG
jgi:hypothetical protein